MCFSEHGRAAADLVTTDDKFIPPSRAPGPRCSTRFSYGISHSQGRRHGRHTRKTVRKTVTQPSVKPPMRTASWHHGAPSCVHIGRLFSHSFDEAYRIARPAAREEMSGARWLYAMLCALRNIRDRARTGSHRKVISSTQVSRCGG